ncbi:MAG: tetratricopeptide repeat protein [Hahellaceae bacterium]|nr:tetratricopeptide repeat protein [Hahellaceae bacterium]
MRKIFLILYPLTLSACSLWSTSSEPIDQLEQGERAYLEGKLDQAAGHFTELIEAHPEYSYGYFKLGNISLQRGLNTQAAAYFRQAIQNHPEDPRYWNNLVIAELRQAKTSLKQAKQAFANQPEKLKTFHRLNALIDTQRQP